MFIVILWPNGWMDQDATWYEGRPWLSSSSTNKMPAATAIGGVTGSFNH